MPTHLLIIAPAAKSDLKNVYQYGLQRWGKNQTNNYLTAIKEQFSLVRSDSCSGTVFS